VEKIVEYHRLGQTNLQISRIGFGCGPASGHDYGPIDAQEWRAAVHEALERGVNLFDVANVYGFGHAEELLADALGPHRANAIIASKCGLIWDDQHRVRRDLSPAAVTQSVHDSLRRLKIDSIPLLQIHWPDSRTPLHETLDALARLHRQGKFKHLGVSNFTLDLLQQAAKTTRIESLQLAYNLLSREPESEIFRWCAQHEVSILAHTALARGALSPKYASSSATDFQDTRKESPYFADQSLAVRRTLQQAMNAISERSQRPAATVALRWILENPVVASALVGIRDRAQLNENLEALGWALMPSERQTLSDISAQSPPGLKGIPAHGASSRTS
jgi:aryl-alcohol dehydrogenase-like predicted oxidoreductase